MLKRLLVCAAGAAALGLFPVAAASAPTYLTATPVAGKYSSAFSLNDAGQFAVNSSPPEIPIEAASISSLLQSESIGSLGGPITRIASINNRGEAVGASATAEGMEHSFLYSSGRMSDLSLLYGTGRVSALNDRGEITGQSRDDRALVIRNGNAEVFGPPHSMAGDINERGDILVEYFEPGLPSRTAVYRQGRLTDLPTRAGGALLGGAINDNGWVSGYGTTSGGRLHAWLYDGVTIADLTPLAANAFASDINNLGQVVGTVDNRAFLYAEGQLVDLNSFVDPAADLLLTSASDINNRGQILAHSCDRAGVFCYGTVLLDAIPPVPEPPAILMLLTALAPLCLHRMRRVREKRLRALRRFAL